MTAPNQTEGKKVNSATAKQDAATSQLARNQILIALACIFLLNLLLRIFYLRYDFVNGDEAVRALTAVRLLEGARLYVDIVTDKPPGATLFYALIFKLFGRSMTAVHLAAAVWNFATAVVVYLTGTFLYTKRIGLWAALFFVYFSTNYLTQDVMAANTELLMALPYTASFCLFMRAQEARWGVRFEPVKSGKMAPAALIAAGVLTGAAVAFKQVGVFNLGLFAVYAIAVRYPARSAGGSGGLGAKAWAGLSLVGLGFASVIASTAAWLKLTGALEGFWRNVVVLGALYVADLPAELRNTFLITRVPAYMLFNLVLWWLAVWAVARSAAALKKHRRHEQGGPGRQDDGENRERRSAEFDLAVALWALVSLPAVFASGRFYGHYFVQALPALSLLAARGLTILFVRLIEQSRRRRARVIAGLLACSLVFGVVRFHHRTAVLAYETISGTRTHFSEAWGMTRREREAEEVAEFVRTRIGPGEPLYIWGFALDVYWRSGCRPASRYLTPNYVMGHFYPEVSTTSEVTGGKFWGEARSQLIEDLRSTRPRLILNIDEAIWTLPYPEIVEFVKENYRHEGQLGSDPSRPFLVFALRENERKPRRKQLQ